MVIVMYQIQIEMNVQNVVMTALIKHVFLAHQVTHVLEDQLIVQQKIGQ